MSGWAPQWRELAAGAGFTEGPVDLGDAVAFVSVNRGSIGRAALDGSGWDVLAETGGGPNGLAVAGDGAIWVAQNGGRVMESRSFATDAAAQRVDTAGGSVTATTDPRLNAPNDCAFGPDGRLWLTDPHGRLVAKDSDGPSGQLWALDPLSGVFELIGSGLPHPNGLCVTPDGDALLVSDTRTREISAWRRDGDGAWGATVVSTLPWGAPDGMAFDARGRLWVAATSAEGVGVIDPDGTWSLVELGPSFPTNVAFAGPDLATIVVTAARGGRVLAADAEAPGLALHRP